MDMKQYKAIIAGRDHLIKALNDGDKSWSGTAAVCAVYEGGKPVISTNQACHYGMRSFETGSIAVVSGLMKPHAHKILDEDEALAFLDYLLNRSPYSEVFITKSAHEALLHKMIVGKSSSPSNLLAAGLVASRRLWEYAEVARVFVDLAKAGVDEDLAFYLAHIARASFDRSGNCDWGGFKNGHCSMNSGAFGKESMTNWLSHKPIRLNNPYSKDVSYNGYAEMFGRDGGLSGWINNNFPYKGAEVKKAGPFQKDEGLAQPGCNYEHFISGMVEFQHAIFKHIGWKQPAVEEAA